MAYELTGKIKLIQDAQTFGSGFTKREMVVAVDDGKYTQEINVEFVQDKIALLDSLKPGEDVTVTFDIRGREYNGRYFNNLQGWKIDSLGGQDIPNQEEPPAGQYFSSPDIEDEDIPF